MITSSGYRVAMTRRYAARLKKVKWPVGVADLTWLPRLSSPPLAIEHVIC
jgi:hypothetical protein